MEHCVFGAMSNQQHKSSQTGFSFRNTSRMQTNFKDSIWGPTNLHALAIFATDCGYKVTTVGTNSLLMGQIKQWLDQWRKLVGRKCLVSKILARGLTVLLLVLMNEQGRRCKPVASEPCVRTTERHVQARSSGGGDEDWHQRL
eukprot:4717693-Amphidinium_carterae.1